MNPCEKDANLCGSGVCVPHGHGYDANYTCDCHDGFTSKELLAFNSFIL